MLYKIIQASDRIIHSYLKLSIEMKMSLISVFSIYYVNLFCSAETGL